MYLHHLTAPHPFNALLGKGGGSPSNKLSDHLAGNSPGQPGKIPTLGRRILVVDDESLIRWSLREQLQKAGFEVIEAEDGRSALAFLGQSDGLGAVFLDLRLPDMDGLEILKRIRETHPHCKVVIMSAFGTPEKVEEALRMGAYRFVSKPFSYQKMVDLASAALSNHSS